MPLIAAAAQVPIPATTCDRDRSAARMLQGSVAYPRRSPRASVRLPWPRFRRPRYDPGRRDVPGPVLTLACPSVAFPTGHETLRLTPTTPRALQFATKLVLLLGSGDFRLCVQDRSGTAKCPEFLRPPRINVLASAATQELCSLTISWCRKAYCTNCALFFMRILLRIRAL